MSVRQSDHRVLVVEDQRPVAAMIKDYVQRVDGFRWVGTCYTAAEAKQFLRRVGVDLVLLDVRLPDESGLAVCRSLRAAGSTVGVIAITSVRDLDVVRTAMSFGVSQYILKPFTFDTLRSKLLGYAQAQSDLASAEVRRQADVDRLMSLSAPEPDPGSSLPANLSKVTMATIVLRLRELGQGGASEIADAVGVSRSTARRYLEHLIDTGQAEQTLQYGRTGRPQVIYRHRP